MDHSTAFPAEYLREDGHISGYWNTFNMRNCHVALILGILRGLYRPRLQFRPVVNLEVLFKEHDYGHVVRPVLKVESFFIGNVKRLYCCD